MGGRPLVKHGLEARLFNLVYILQDRSSGQFSLFPLKQPFRNRQLITCC